MDHGKLPLLPVLLARTWSVALQIIRPIARALSPKFNERESAIEKQWTTISKNNETQSVWIHAASLGEFEQARPIIESIKKNHPQYQITLTFFSPSGYRIRKSYNGADRVLYLPLDILANTERFLDVIEPDIIMFVRYELWLNYLLSARKRAIPVYAVNATFPSSDIWKYFRPILRSLLNLFSEIYTVGEEHTERFLALNPRLHVHTGSDTRIDRIYEQVQNMRQSPHLINEIIPLQKSEQDCIIVLGSSWQEDEQMFLEALPSLDEHVRLIIVPHEPEEHVLERLLNTVPDAVLLSDLSKHNAKHIIVDSIGKLLAIYAIADAAYIGGGFGAGVHSCAEPAGYGIPLSCGPFIDRSPDAIALNTKGALEVVRTSSDAAHWMHAVAAGAMKHAGEAAEQYIGQAQGMTSTIVKEIVGNGD